MRIAPDVSLFASFVANNATYFTENQIELHIPHKEALIKSFDNLRTNGKLAFVIPSAVRNL
jgi:hypothetical protein